MQVGDKYKTVTSGTLEVVEVVNSNEVKVVFVDTKYTTTTRKCLILQGKVKDLLFPSVYSVGYLGVGDYKCKGNRAYVMWGSMLQRCYDIKYQSKQPTYVGCSVCQEWHNFQVFAKWYEDTVLRLKKGVGYHLDKDILYKGNKIYSQKTCSLVPPEVNNLLTYDKTNKGLYPTGVTASKTTGKFRARINVNCVSKCLGYYHTVEDAYSVYVDAKESRIKQQALESYTKNEISVGTYEALIRWRL